MEIAFKEDKLENQRDEIFVFNIMWKSLLEKNILEI